MSVAHPVDAVCLGVGCMALVPFVPDLCSPLNERPNRVICGRSVTNLDVQGGRVIFVVEAETLTFVGENKGFTPLH